MIGTLLIAISPVLCVLLLFYICCCVKKDVSITGPESSLHAPLVEKISLSKIDKDN
jgi:hypothetical protein